MKLLRSSSLGLFCCDGSLSTDLRTTLDRYGRRRPLLLVGLAGFALGGLLAASAESFEVLVIARVPQGLGAASIASII